MKNGYLAIALAILTIGVDSVAYANGTTLTDANKTAAGFFERRISYNWGIDKSVNPDSLSMGQGETKSVTYTINVTRTLGQTTDTYGVRGEICVTNGGAVATDSLTITDVVQTKVGGNPYSDYKSQSVDTGAHSQLAPNERQCYNYEVTFPPAASGTLYRNQARITINNHAGHIGTPYGPSPSAGFSLPTGPTISETDEAADVADAEQCPSGFTCNASNPGPFNFTGTNSVTFTKGITDDSAACGSVFNLPNKAILTTNDTHTVFQASASVAITTANCPPVVKGCTHTIGFWKTPQHLGNWPVTSLKLGDRDYSQNQLVSILNQPVQGNGLISLAHQLIAAKLNVATGATVPTSVANAITAADTLIDGLIVPPVGTGILAPRTTSGLTSTLDTYNNGLAEGGPPHCE